jgi:hypothetical protein
MRTMSTPQDVLRIAASQLGVTESPAGSNRQKFSAELNRPAEPWCADFVVWVMRQAGITLPNESAYTPYMLNGFRSSGASPTMPAPGDCVFFNFNGGRGPEHVGIITHVGPTHIESIEGNTSPSTAGSQANGGGVFRRMRHRSVIVGFGRPAYSVPKEIRAMYDPPLQIAATLDCHTGGTWAVAPDGAIFAFGGAPYLGGANGKDYFVGRRAARLELVDGKYRIVATSGEGYGPGF